MNEAQIIKLCIERCARHQDGRGPWQAEQSCRNALAVRGSPTVSAAVAESARRIGQWLKQAGRA